MPKMGHLVSTCLVQNHLRQCRNEAQPSVECLKPSSVKLARCRATYTLSNHHLPGLKADTVTNTLPADALPTQSRATQPKTAEHATSSVQALRSWGKRCSPAAEGGAACPARWGAAAALRRQQSVRVTTSS